MSKANSDQVTQIIREMISESREKSDQAKKDLAEAVSAFGFQAYLDRINDVVVCGARLNVLWELSERLKKKQA